MLNPWRDTQFLSAVDRWHRIRQSIRIPHNPLPPTHADHIFCGYMFICFDGDTSPMYDYMAGGYKTRKLTAAFHRARAKYYERRLDER